jgi:phosphoribosylanthranilate isomerase
MHMVKVKICGVTTFADALAAAEAGADLLGFNFYRKSPRYLEPQAACDMAAGLRAQLGAACPLLVGVFVNEPVSAISAALTLAGIGCAQLSGDESEALLRELRGIGFKAVRPATVVQALDDVQYFSASFPTDERLPSLLLDAHHPQLYGGTGAQASDDIALAVRARVPRLMLAGGLTPDNVAARVQAARPWGVDTASGVEVDGQPGVKDHGKMRAFVEAARRG